jgi:hypothetical protein
LFKRALTYGILALAAAPVFADTVAIRTGTPNVNFPIGAGGSTSIAVDWTQAAGTTYSAATIAASLNTTNGSIASGTAYLTNSLGVGAANVTAPVPFTIPATQTTSTLTTLFTGLTLPPGTYFLTISNGSGNLGWGSVTGGATEAPGTGVTVGLDLQDLATPPPALPPSSATFVTPLTNGSQRSLVFSATGALGGGGGGGGGTPTGVPTLGSWAIVGTFLLLGGSGLLLMKRRPQQ